MKIGPKGLELIKSFESFVPYPYDDKVAPVKGKYPEWKGGPLRGTATIGYGHTDNAKHPLKVVPGIKITEKQALEILAVDLGDVEATVNRLVKVKLNQGQFDAICSFVFNCGAGTAKPVLVRINAGNLKGARDSLDLYTKSGGEYMRGLQRRRDAEQALWDLGDYLASEELPVVLPTETVYHPAEIDQVKDPKISTETKEVVATGVIVGAGGAGLFFDWPWQYIIPAVIIILFIAFLVFRYIKRRSWIGKSTGEPLPVSSLPLSLASLSVATVSNSQSRSRASLRSSRRASSAGSYRLPKVKSRSASRTK